MLHVIALMLEAMQPGAPAPGCPAGQTACFYEEPDGDPGQCIVALYTAAGWHHTEVANCSWMVIGSTPSVTATLQQLERRDRSQAGGRDLVVRFRLEVYARGERERDGSRPGLRKHTDFLVVCTDGATTPACSPPLVVAGGVIGEGGRRHRMVLASWRRSWHFDGRGRLVLGRVIGDARSCALDPEGMYGAPGPCTPGWTRAQRLELRP
jgi:hypothetical protein